MTETDSQHTWSRTQDVVALDAELIFTTAGMSIVRITLVDESGEVLVDQLIKPSAPAIDYNTRFSGVSAADFEADAATEIFPSLGAAQMAVAEFVGPKTVLIGHGLENDLRAMRLVHDRVADTALLFPHSKGLPMRLSLRELAKRHLGILIQIAGAAGHSSLEDARVAQEIVRWKLVEDPHSSPFRERKPSAAGSTTSPIHPGPESPALAIHSPSTPLTGDFGQYLRPPPSPSLSGPDGGAGPSDSHNQGQASGQTLPLARTRPAPPPPRVNPRAAASLFVPKKRPPPS
ncbi:ribonuclease H-like protein [Ceraceosorus guamensis]|uniref:Ribonuclease H-like protein n=1 Tax=Ceraceosorus guamensis TaxID=1522189 RepID=A0A316VPW7_9BASI|nr:ribonuclease H-like protein [Ceraceosorus guamensis]PWN39689.1 ribonuclease H-like protein [Ceraceosorus guamensis]